MDVTTTYDDTLLEGWYELLDVGGTYDDVFEGGTYEELLPVTELLGLICEDTLVDDGGTKVLSEITDVVGGGGADVKVRTTVELLSGGTYELLDIGGAYEDVELGGT